MQKIERKYFVNQALSNNKYVDNTRYLDCRFDGCNLSEYTFTNCEFINCIFQNCSFRSTFLAMNKNEKSGLFLNSLFVSCDFTETNFRFPGIEKCEFRNCILKETNFDGSRFSEVKFTGELDGCFFKGYSKYATRNSLFSFFRGNPKDQLNKMINVDFSNAKLVGVSFTNGIELGKCIFPEGGNYIYIKDLRKTMLQSIEVIKQEWPEGYKRDTGLKLIENLYFNKDLQDQKDNFIDSNVINEIEKIEDDEGVGMKLFDLIKSLQ